MYAWPLDMKAQPKVKYRRVKVGDNTKCSSDPNLIAKPENVRLVVKGGAVLKSLAG